MGKKIWKLPEKLKQMKKNQWLIILLVGILLLVIAIPVNPEVKQKEQPETGEIGNGSTHTDVLEERLVSALEKVSGVGKVQVMLTRKSSGEKVIEKDQTVTDKNTKEEDSEGGSRTNMEQSKGEETVYLKDGSGNETPYVIEEIEPQIAGVVVVAEGGNNSIVVQNITEAVMALFGVEAHKIKVMKMN